MHSKSFFSLGFAVLFFSGCNHVEFPSDGHFEGFVRVRHLGKTTSVPVQAWIERRPHDTLWVRAFAETNQDGARHAWGLAAQPDGDDRIVVVSSRPEAFPLLRLKSAGANCYEAPKNEREARALACTDSRALSLHTTSADGMEGFSITLDRLVARPVPRLENPRSYALSELLALAARHSFNSRIEFEHVIQAKQTSKTATLNLIPHLSINSVAAIAVMDWAGLAGAIGDLIPFVLPTRWLQAVEMDLRHEAERDALLLMKADTVNIVEGMGYALLRDLKIREILKDNAALVESYLEPIQARERGGQYLPGAGADIAALLNSLKQDLSTLDLMIHEEYTALAQAVGFMNPQAIAELESLREDFDPATLPVQSAEELSSLAVRHSIELRQMAWLIDAGKRNRDQRYFQSIDPTGDPAGGLGAALPSYISIGNSQVNELEIRQDVINSLLLQKAANIALERTQSTDAYRLASEGLAIQDERIERINHQMRSGMHFNPVTLLMALQDHVKAGITKVTTEYGFYLLRAKRNRLLFEGPYAGLEF